MFIFSIKIYQAVSTNISSDLINRISNYIQSSKQILTREFNQIDKGMSGHIPVWEVKKVFQYNGYDIKTDELEQFTMNFGVFDNYSKMINYSK